MHSLRFSARSVPSRVCIFILAYGTLLTCASTASASPRAEMVTPGRMAATTLADTLTGDLHARLGRLTPFELDEVVWLARCIYSESDRPHEQELVAWVVRNRVETQYRGTTYREVILETKQFSAFNHPTRRRSHIVSLTPSTPTKSWQRALGIALDVYQASPTRRPFAQTVRHFYSPVSMKGRTKPVWADSGEQLSSSSLGVDPFRFRFFSNVDEGIASAEASEPPELSEKKRREGGGFLMPTMKPSGRVARPRRPSVRPAKNRP